MRQIDWSKPLSDEDREWLLMSGQQGIEARIADHDEKFADDEEEDDDEDVQPPTDEYETMTVQALADLMTARGLAIPPKAKKSQVVAILREDDETKTAAADAE